MFFGPLLTPSDANQGVDVQAVFGGDLVKYRIREEGRGTKRDCISIEGEPCVVAPLNEEGFGFSEVHITLCRQDWSIR